MEDGGTVFWATRILVVKYRDDALTDPIIYRIAANAFLWMGTLLSYFLSVVSLFP
jgi:hypothetical protein